MIYKYLQNIQTTMKKILLILAMVGMVAVACTPDGVDEDNNGNQTEQPDNGGGNGDGGGDGNEDEIPTDKIVIEPTTIEVAAEASDYVVAVSSPCSWRATTENEWITIETKLGIDGKRELIFSVADSYEVEPREGKILVSNSDEGLSAELVVTQKALVPEWSIDVETLHFEANGGEQTIEIVANFIEYQATSEVDWITFEYQEKGVVVKVATSNIDEERSAEITISKEKYDLSKTITIVQYAQDANRLIYYTSSDNAVVRPDTYSFNESIVSNTYNDNRGVILFDAPVTSIGGHTFENCTSLTSITIPDSVTSIGDEAFQNCTSLTSVTIGNSVTKIGSYAFEDCTLLTSITIPDSVTSIGNSAFYGCTSLTDAYVNITDLATYATSNQMSEIPATKHLLVNGIEITNLTIPDGVTTIGDGAFQNCTSLTSITIPDSVTSIGDGAFQNCTSLTSVTIGNSVTYIGVYAFRVCTSLTSITIPDSVTEIGWEAFSGCTSLTSVTIGNSVTSIDSWTFYGCKSLTSVTIPDGVTTIGDGVFRDCTSLTEVYCKPTTPPAIYYYSYSYVGSFPFNSGLKIYVPRNSYEAYMQYSSYSDGSIAKKNWYKYESYIEPYDFE